MQSNLGVIPTRDFERQPLYCRLMEAPWTFDFFRAVWLFERSLGSTVVSGLRGPVAREILRFRPFIMMGFPATDLRRIRRIAETADGQPIFRLDVTFLGLYGVSTPLPLHYAVKVLRNTELESGDVPGSEVEPADVRSEAPHARAAEAAASRSVGLEDYPETNTSPLRDFIDLIHHRVISFFYRAWTKYHYDMSFGVPGRDDITRYMMMLVGCQPDDTESTLGVQPIRLIRYAGLLTQHPRSAVSLEGVLSDYWQGRLSIRLDQHVGRWVPLPLEDVNRMGRANCRLGENLTAGEQVFDLSGAFNIHIGPVDWDTYVDLLPDRAAHGQTRALARFFCADPLRFTVEVRLKPGVVPETRMTSDGAAGRLGLTSWVRTKDVPETSVIFSETSCATSCFNADRGRSSNAVLTKPSHASGSGAPDRNFVAAGPNRPVG